MANDTRISVRGGALFQRKIKKLAGGASISWDDVEVRKKIWKAIEKVNERGARKLKRQTRSIYRQGAYDEGGLYRSVKSSSLRHSTMKMFGKGVAGFAWMISVGGRGVDYAAHVELGRYYKSTGTRVKGVPALRMASVLTRRWMRPRMKSAIRRALK